MRADVALVIDALGFERDGGRDGMAGVGVPRPNEPKRRLPSTIAW